MHRNNATPSRLSIPHLPSLPCLTPSPTKDADAWVAKINLQGLLASLVPVETRVDVDVYRHHAVGGGHNVMGGHRKKPLQQLLASPTGSVQ